MKTYTRILFQVIGVALYYLGRLLLLAGSLLGAYYYQSPYEKNDLNAFFCMLVAFVGCGMIFLSWYLKSRVLEDSSAPVSNDAINADSPRAS